MLALDPLVDNTGAKLEDVYRKIIPQCEEVRIATGPRPGVFGLAHLWFAADDEAPIGRIRRVFYYKPFGDDVSEKPVRVLGIDPDTDGEPISGNTTRILGDRDRIQKHLDDRLESIREGQVRGAFEQGEAQSKEQQTILSYLRRYLEHTHGDEPLSEPVGDCSTVGERAGELRGRLREVMLKNTDEDTVLQETFRHNDEYESLMEWPPEEFLNELEAFLNEHIEESTEYQETLVKESEVRSRLVCWGVVSMR